MSDQPFDAAGADALLQSLGEQLAAVGARFDLVVIGGSGLLALGRVPADTRRTCAR